ncbi:MAG: hypothetical protein JWL86_1008 [Rhizobium sp.]|nr:hypothetical protein [Rhizobium sp.]
MIRAAALGPDNWKRIPDLILVAIAAGLVLLVAWSCGRGLDLLDESHSLLDAFHPADSVVGASAASGFLAPVFTAVGHDISLFRFTGLALLVSSTIFLAYRTRRLAAEVTDGRLRLSIPSLVATSLIGSLLYYFWFIRGPSYNLLIVVGSYLFSGLFLWMLEARPGTRSFSVRATGIGVLWGCCLLVKFPSGVALLALAGMAFLLWHNWSWRYAGLFAAHFAAGAAALLALYFVFVEAPDALFARVSGMFEILKSPGFKSPPGGYIIRYLSQSSLGLLKALHDFWPAFVCVGVGFATSFVVRDRNKSILCITIGFFVALALFNGIAVRAGFYGWQFTPQDLFYYYFLATALVLMTIAGAAIAISRHESSGIELIDCKRLSIVVAFLLATPLAASFGTANQITVNALLAMAPWFIGTTILVTVLSRQCLRSWIGPTVMLTLGTMACADVISGAMHPYGIYATIFEQTERTELGPGGHSLKLDAATSSYVSDLRNLANRGGITAQSDVMFFYDSPGSVLVIGAHSPGVPWFFSEAPDASILALTLVSRERLQRAYLLVDLQAPPPPSLSRFGVNFPADYELVGEVLRRPIQHHIQLWRPRAP